MNELGKLRWRCRRGMKELDDLLLRYLENEYANSSVQEQMIFSQLLELQDPQLFAYISKREIPEPPAVRAVVEKIAAFKR